MMKKRINVFHDQLSHYRSYSREETRDVEQLNCNGTKENQTTECTQVNCATLRIIILKVDLIWNKTLFTCYLIQFMTTFSFFETKCWNYFQETNFLNRFTALQPSFSTRKSIRKNSRYLHMYCNTIVCMCTLYMYIV